MSNYPDGVSSRDFDDDGDYILCKNCSVPFHSHYDLCRIADIRNVNDWWDPEFDEPLKYEESQFGTWDD